MIAEDYDESSDQERPTLFNLTEAEMFIFFDNPLVKDDLNSGVDLYDEKCKIDEVLFTKEKEILLDYVKESEEMRKIYNELDECESLLESLENSLQGFQEELVHRLNEISTSREEVKKKKVKYNNYQNLANQLGNFVNEVYLPDNLIRALLKGKINMIFLEYLDSFVKKINFIEALSNSDCNMHAIKEQEALAKDLIAKIVEKIREWVLSKTSLTNLNSIQTLRKVQKPLSKYGQLFSFLSCYNDTYAKEVASHYVGLASRIYFENMKKKVSYILSCYSPLAGYNDLLGEPEAPNPGVQSWSFFNIGMSNNVIKNKVPIYSLGQRRAVLENMGEVFSLPSSTTTTTTTKPQTEYTYEMLFRFIHDNLLIFVKEESEFCKKFFSADFTDGVLNETIVYLQTFIDQIKDNYDVLGLLIVQGTVQYYQESYVTKSNSNVLTEYFNNITNQVQTKAIDTMRRHLLSLVASLEKIDQLGDIYSFSAHYITRRTAEFVLSILALKKLLIRPNILNIQSTNPPNSINEMLQAICKALLKLLQKIAEVKFTDKQQPHEESFFLINNYDVLVSIGHERGVATEEVVKLFEREIQKIVQSYSTSLLKKHFSFLFNFVDKYATRDEKDTNQSFKIVNTPNCTAVSVEKIMKEFSEGDHWKKILEHIDKEIKTKIANYERGLLIFQKLLTLIFEYYSCFNDIIQMHFKEVRSSSYFIPKSEISYAMKNLTFFTEEKK